MAGRNIPAPKVSCPGILYIAACSPYRYKLRGWRHLAWWRSPSLGTPKILQIMLCQMPAALNGFREPLISGALPVRLSPAVTLSLWPK